MDEFYIDKVSLDHSDISHLLEESLSEGHRHIKRLFEEFASGRNTFSNEGEALFAAVINERIIGICGLNIDPYVEGKHVGRVRRLYVSKKFRRHGIGRSLMQAVIQEAQNTIG
ncbi:GNAT family N-acetyltransferase [Cohnella kolymensis]|uniref:GNAT family N-acetyltransferase n=1 Tax=Cohnella kolymensis TaxID=1590652 RepID=UPI0006979118|nr:GNAT family N-acetyltransferase [Cohnella kolymensis]